MGIDYLNSIAEKNVTFVTQTIISTVPGDNYYKAMVFIPDADKATYLTGTPTSTTTLTVTSTNYASLTKGLLQTWLACFFANNSVSSVFLCVFTTLSTTYTLYKTNAYFKFTIDSTGSTSDLALATLIAAEGKDKKLSQLWIGSADATGAVATTLKAAAEDAVVVYHADATKNAAMEQLGASLAIANSTGTPVGNSLAYAPSVNTILPSSNVASTNLTAAQYGPLEALNIGYYSMLGDNTTYVAMQGGKTVLGDNSAANWVRDFIGFVSEIETTELITQLNVFNNNDSYQKILGILSNNLKLFSDLGRLANVKITAPVFAALNLTGSILTIPNAWQANFVSNIGTVMVYGKLYVTI